MTAWNQSMNRIKRGDDMKTITLFNAYAKAQENLSDAPRRCGDELDEIAGEVKCLPAGSE